MNSDLLSGGLALAAAAGLWFIYLLPTWLKRREYLATERNAVRLQQTLRIMAQTAQLPDQVATEVSARGVAEQQRQLRRQVQKEQAVAKAREAAEERADRQAVELAKRLAEAERAAVAERNALRMAPVQRVSPTQASRLRRSRLMTTLVVAVAIVVGVVAIVQAAWILLAVMAVAAIGGVVLLGRIAAKASILKAPVLVTQATHFSALVDHAVLSDAHQEASRGWIPTQIPKPLYLSHPVVDAAQLEREQVALQRQAAQLQEASRRSEQALRDAQQTVPALPGRSVSEDEGTSPSRFASMGIVEDAASDQLPDLDEVLRRRRAS